MQGGGGTMSKDPYQNTRKVDPSVITETDYDVVIVGSGVSGAILAKELSRKGARILIMEAGPERT